MAPTVSVVSTMGPTLLLPLHVPLYIQSTPRVLKPLPLQVWCDAGRGGAGLNDYLQPCMCKFVQVQAKVV